MNEWINEKKYKKKEKREKERKKKREKEIKAIVEIRRTALDPDRSLGYFPLWAPFFFCDIIMCFSILVWTWRYTTVHLKTKFGHQGAQKGALLAGFCMSHFGHILKGGHKSYKKIRKIARFFTFSF